MSRGVSEVAYDCKVPIENFLKTHVVAATGKTFGISDAIMVGDKRKYNICLITLTAKVILSPLFA